MLIEPRLKAEYKASAWTHPRKNQEHVKNNRANGGSIDQRALNALLHMSLLPLDPHLLHLRLCSVLGLNTTIFQMVVKLQINHRFCQVVVVKTPNVAQLFDQTPMLAPIFSHVLSLLMVQQFNSSTLNNILQHVMSPQSHHSKMPKKHTSEGPCYSASVLPRSSPESS
jgi:hypothetical protein